MIYLLSDLDNSAQRLADVGEMEGIRERRERMHKITARIMAVAPPTMRPTNPEGKINGGAIHQVGTRTGDGLLFVANDELGEGLYLKLLAIQSEPHALPAVFAISRGIASWDGDMWDARSAVDGRVVDFTGRMLKAADAGAIAMNREYYEMLPADLRRGAEQRAARFKSFEDRDAVYWHAAAAWWLREETMVLSVKRIMGRSNMLAVGLSAIALVLAIGAWLR